MFVESNLEERFQIWKFLMLNFIFCRNSTIWCRNSTIPAIYFYSYIWKSWVPDSFRLALILMADPVLPGFSALYFICLFPDLSIVNAITRSVYLYLLSLDENDQLYHMKNHQFEKPFLLFNKQGISLSFSKGICYFFTMLAPNRSYSVNWLFIWKYN